MKKLIWVAVFCLAICGGCRMGKNKMGDPIVSPDAIQSVEADESEPQIPHYEPIWYNLNP